MAKLLDQSEVYIEWNDIQKRIHRVPAQKERSAGVHVTDILKYLHFGSLPSTATDKDRDSKKQEWADIEDPEVMPLKMALGMAFEEFIVGLEPDMLWQPAEVDQDGISGSPDGYSYREDWLMVDEFKLTWKSCRTREILKENLWMWQVKSYCHLAYGTEYARMHVCWVNGDYSHPYTPRYFKYLIQFDEEELDRHWKMMVSNKDKAVEWNQSHQWNGKGYVEIAHGDR